MNLEPVTPNFLQIRYPMKEKHAESVKFTLSLLGSDFVWKSDTAKEPFAYAFEKFVKRNLKRKFENPYAWLGATGGQDELDN